MRFGRLTAKSIAKFRSLSRNIEYEDGLGATELYVLAILENLGVHLVNYLRPDSLGARMLIDRIHLE
jgi:hypothetical protein